MSWQVEHPAASPAVSGKVCLDVRCATLLEADAEICDECGGIDLADLADIPVMLCGWADDRPVVFALSADKASIVGRSVPGGVPPDIDLRRLPGSGTVHRRHAFVELEDGEWQVTHLGTNPLVVIGSEAVALESGQTVKLRSGDALQVGNVPLQFLARSSPRRIGGS